MLEVLSHLPTSAPKPTPLLFIHGAWHGAWCWENFLPYFAALGYAAHALSLRGHGGSDGRSRLRWASAARDYVNDVAQVAARLPTPPILIGHSLGGYVVQKYLEQHTAPAAILLAPLPIAGTRGLALRYLLHHPRACLRTLQTCDPYHLVGTLALAESAFFSTTTPLAASKPHIARLQTESMLVMLEATFNPPHPQRITTAIHVIGAANDRVFTTREIEATASAYRTHATFLPIAHDMMLEPNWQVAAAAVAARIPQHE